MILYLRDEKNRTILDVEVFVKTEDSKSFVELHSVVDIANYSYLLLKTDVKAKQLEIIADFDELSELRGWLWEHYFMGRQNNKDEYDSVVKELKRLLKLTAEKYQLSIVED